MAYLYCRTKVGASRTEEERKREAIEPRLKVANATTSPATTFLPPPLPPPPLFLTLSKGGEDPTSLPFLSLPFQIQGGKRKGGRTKLRKPSLWICRCQGTAQLPLTPCDETNDDSSPDKKQKPPGWWSWNGTEDALFLARRGTEEEVDKRLRLASIRAPRVRWLNRRTPWKAEESSTQF